MDKHKISKSVIFPIPIKGIDYFKSNQYIADANKKYPERFIPFGLMDNSIDYWINQGFKGFKENTRLEEINECEYTEYYLKLEQHGLPLIIHPLFKDKVGRIKSIAAVAPKLKVILAHMGRSHLFTDEDVMYNLRELKKYENVYFETSTVRVCKAIENAVNIVGPDRVMFGSDYPFSKELNEDSIEIEKNVVLMSRISEDKKQKIFGMTIKSLIL
jgi:predicted TIM-barrel fold metal-dependent hydrolase